MHIHVLRLRFDVICCNNDISLVKASFRGNDNEVIFSNLDKKNLGKSLLEA